MTYDRGDVITFAGITGKVINVGENTDANGETSTILLCQNENGMQFIVEADMIGDKRAEECCGDAAALGAAFAAGVQAMMQSGLSLEAAQKACEHMLKGADGAKAKLAPAHHKAITGPLGD